MCQLLHFCFSIFSLINKLKPGIIKKVNRRSTPIAGLVSDVINPVFCSTFITWSSGLTVMHDGSNRLLFRTFFWSRVSLSCWICFYSSNIHANAAFYLGFGLFLMVSPKCNCQICPKQQRGEINSDLPPRANDRNPAAGGRSAPPAVTDSGDDLNLQACTFLKMLTSIQIDSNLHWRGYFIEKYAIIIDYYA